MLGLRLYQLGLVRLHRSLILMHAVEQQDIPAIAMRWNSNAVRTS